MKHLLKRNNTSRKDVQGYFCISCGGYCSGTCTGYCSGTSKNYD